MQLQSFRNFDALKKALGTEKGHAWHHIVEQSKANTARFGNEAIQNTGNVVRLPHGKGTIHQKISNYYSTKQQFTNGLTVRKWLQTQSFKAQYDFGVRTLERVTKGQL